MSGDPRGDGGWAGYAGVALAIAAVVVLVVLGWSERDRMVGAEVGAVAPDFTAIDLSGDSVSLGDHDGKVVLLNFWATWCPPCLEEMPSMQRMQDELAERGFVVLAVSVDAEPPGGDVRALVQDFADELDLSFPIVLDPDGRVESRYSVSGLPTTFLIDRDGVIQARVIGGRYWDEGSSRARILELLEG